MDRSYRDPCKELRLVDTILEAVAYHIFDARKMEQIVETVRKRLSEEHSLDVTINIEWRPPVIRSYEDLSL